MKNFHRMIRTSSVLVFLLALCCLPLTVYAKDKNKNKKQGISYEADIDYPVFEKEPLLNAQISDIVQKSLEAFNNEFFSAESPAYPQVFEFDIDSSSVYEDTNHISFLLNVYQFTGGAHGTTSLAQSPTASRRRNCFRWKKPYNQLEKIGFLSCRPKRVSS